MYGSRGPAPTVSAYAAARSVALGVLVEQTIATLQASLVEAGDFFRHPPSHQQLEAGTVLTDADSALSIGCAESRDVARRGVGLDRVDQSTRQASR